MTTDDPPLLRGRGSVPCTVCGQVLDPVLSDLGERTHPGCSTDPLAAA